MVVPSTLADYTQEQVKAVGKVLRCKNYYQILGVSEEVSEVELKRAYRKLALRLHPDKNKAPGAREAFQVLGYSYKVLLDPYKRRWYNLYGREKLVINSRSHGSGHRSDPSYGFQHSMIAEEDFNGFFLGGKPGQGAERSSQEELRKYDSSSRGRSWEQWISNSPRDGTQTVTEVSRKEYREDVTMEHGGKDNSIIPKSNSIVLKLYHD